MLDLMGRVPELSDQIITVFAARRQQQIERSTSSIKVIGSDRDPDIQKVEAFLSRSRIPFQSFDLDGSDDEALALCKLVSHKPAVTLDHDRKIAHPTPRKVARELNLNLDIPDDLRTDVLIVGGGPAGVSAAVNAGARGAGQLLVVEDIAIGGQAGASNSRIENYMGFPTGISGADLVFRGQIQALRFGACFAMPCRVERLSVEKDGLFCVTVDDGARVLARAVLIATGVRYRRLPLEGPEAARKSRACSTPPPRQKRDSCRNTDAVVVGGGNSAGQAAMYHSRVARHVHVLVRGDTLSDTMSSYLLQRLKAQPNIEIHFGSEAIALHGGDHLEAMGTVRVRRQGRTRCRLARFSRISARHPIRNGCRISWTSIASDLCKPAAGPLARTGRWKPLGPESSPSAMCVLARRSGSRLRPGRGRSWSQASTSLFATHHGAQTRIV